MRLGHQYVCVRNYFSIRLCIFGLHVVFVFSIHCSLAFSGNCFAGVQRTTVQRRKRSIRNVNIDTLSCIPNERLQRQCLPKMLQLYLRFFFMRHQAPLPTATQAPCFHSLLYLSLHVSWLNCAVFYFQSLVISFRLQLSVSVDCDFDFDLACRFLYFCFKRVSPSRMSFHLIHNTFKLPGSKKLNKNALSKKLVASKIFHQ